MVTLIDAPTVQRASFAELSERVDRLARALQRLGIEQGDRVGTFAWNNQRHLELYFAVPCIGAVLHTLNIRLFDDQLIYIVNHAEDRVIFVDDSLVPLLEKLAPSFRESSTSSSWATATRARCPTRCATRSCSRTPARARFDYPELDERQAAALCYTSGTTGNPKGVLYSHRSISLHSTVTLTKDGTGLSHPTACWRSCRCSTSTPGGCPTARRWPERT